MSTDYQDDFFWSAIECGGKLYVVMDYYLITDQAPPLGEPFDTAWEALREADRRNEQL